ncbi:MAG: mobile mystery protein A [Candidatus Marinimicrobia bacterium]|jgi:predicted DNA-binding mobile mystery protein A|nr:mobile mystery protein A [Candidatus Neomarinimicrobiota bacterium]MBT3497067.1 mobile mystery protein A [Candidatus Neomarinimicrobiota bacterium]MBT3732103.1 mobile mystery protein A [Candidatus Neomarinimicrobiota bacterium]MBT4144883.1 mobile mystery protein A [Candidatus Neomarinimicrobiota bacterium]MBT4177932.1 mobile mystery protein A [Candidatus Neomarinimicrobiota bacterium]
MKKQNLIINQLQEKIDRYKELAEVSLPPKGWIYAIRTALKMSLKQLGKRMSITSQSVWEIEDREKNGNITLNNLRQIGSALNMRFVYGFIPNHESLNEIIASRAKDLATEIVQRASVSMDLEDQKPSEERIEKAIEEKTQELIEKLPRFLWD